MNTEQASHSIYLLLQYSHFFSTIDRSVVNAPLPPPQFVASSLIYRLRRWLISHAAVNNYLCQRKIESGLRHDDGSVQPTDSFSSRSIFVQLASWFTVIRRYYLTNIDG
jgi:hypothetical protein